jgi:hypothetical protein
VGDRDDDQGDEDHEPVTATWPASLFMTEGDAGP